VAVRRSAGERVGGPAWAQSPTSAVAENTRPLTPASLASSRSSLTAASSFVRLRETRLTLQLRAMYALPRACGCVAPCLCG